MVREANEDAILSREKIGLWAVADGLGGHAVGDVASRMVVESLAETQRKPHLNDMVVGVEDSLINANSNIFEYADIMLENATMGTTVVSLIIQGLVGVCLWVGDSRLYRYRRNELMQMSRDHSQVEEWVQQGIIKPEESENHPQGNIITRAIGVGENVDIDVSVFSTRIGDTFLLCSDGLYNAVSKNDIGECLRLTDVQDCVDKLMMLALENGAPDNVSIIVIKGELGRVAT